MVNYSETDVRRATTHNAFAAGRLYRNQGRVVSFEWTTDGAKAKVQGGGARPYQQRIVIGRNASGAAAIAGSCDCPVGLNCKHVAAALFEGLARGPAKPLTPEAKLSQRLDSLMGGRTAAGPASRPDGLRHDLAAWLDDLDRAQATADDTYPASVAQRLVYVLVPVTLGHKAPMLGLKPISTKLLKTGQFSQSERVYPIDRVASGPEAKFLRPIDLKILADLARLRRDHHITELPLYRDVDGRILSDILETGRARWLTVNGPELRSGDPRPGKIVWTLQDQAEMRPTIEIGDGLLVLNASPPVYVDVAAGLIGAIETGLAPKIAAALLDAPPIPADQVAHVNQAILKRTPDLAHLRPADPAPPRIVEEPPIPSLRLFAARLPVTDAPPYLYQGNGYGVPEEEVGLARLSFRYGPILVPLTEDRQTLTRLHEGALLEIHRDIEAERQHLSTLLSRGFVPSAEARPSVKGDLARDFLPEGDAIAWFDMLYHDLPELAAVGWEIDVAPDFPYRLLRADGTFDAEVHEGSGIDWFELDLGIVIDGERIDLIGPIVALISAPDFDPALLRIDEREENQEPFYLPLGEGRFLAVSVARIAPIVAAIQELFAGGVGENGRLRLKPSDAAGLAELEAATLDASVIWRGGEKIREMGRRLSAAGGIPAVVLPENFHATLRPYQAEGVSWLAFLREVGFGGVLADDMGLGKTVQALALIAIEKAAGRLDRPALVVAPTSLMANWRREAERFAPDLRVLTLQGLDRKSRFGEIDESDLVLTTYPLIARDHEVLGDKPWHLLILDEAQTIKNPEAATTKLVLGLEARHRFCLSGTPLENHLGELWSLFSFAVPGLLGDRSSFTRLWRTPIERQGHVARAQALARRVRPFMLRRTKEQVAPDLPPKTEIVERIEFQSAQRDIYESIRLTMHKRVQDAIAAKGFARSRIVILDALLKLRQVCCDPRLLKLTTKAASKAGSAKLERLEEMLEELHAERRRILVFSQFTSMLDLIRPRLDAANIGYSLLTGDTRDRESAIRSFQEGKTPVFLVSLKAGGTGLNLTAADTVILYDPWWNPAVEEQAIDRAHRIGQDKPVFVHKLVAAGTIEEKMEILKEKKRALAESMFDQDSAPTLDMTESDLDMLFAAE